MVFMEIKKEEIEAIDALYYAYDNDRKVPIRICTLLGLLRSRMQQAINNEIDKINKEKYSPKNKDGKNENK